VNTRRPGLPSKTPISPPTLYISNQKTPIKYNNPLTVHRLYPCQIPWYHAHLFTLRRIEYVTHSHFYNLEWTSSELIQVFQNLCKISESIRNFRIVPSFRIYAKFQNRVGTCGPPYISHRKAVQLLIGHKSNKQETRQESGVKN